MESMDLFAVTLCMLVIRQHRAFHYNFIAKPLYRFALRRRHIRHREDPALLKKIDEQTRLFCWHTLSFSVGVALFFTDEGRKYAPSWGSTMDKGVWEGYPTDALKMPVGVWAFYVAQMGFWGDGLLNTISGSREVERRDDKKRPNGLAPRKRDIKQCSEKAQELWALRIHHTTALVLLLTSHFMHFWRIGHLIITLMDISDVLLSLAKSLRYVQYQLPCDITFAMFALSWFVTRHALYARILWSTLFESVRRIPVKTFDPWGTGSWFHWGVYWFYAVVLVGLQGLMVRWGWMIIGVLGRVLVGKEAADSRSDDECESEEESNEKKKEEGARVDSEDESLERLSVADEDLVDAMFLKDSDKDASSATRFLNNK